MKKIGLFLLFLNSFFNLTLKAQTSAGDSAIIIDNTVSGQSLPKIRAAQNGWLFTGFVIRNYYKVFCSKDDGKTWNNIIDVNARVADWDMEVTGGTIVDTTVKVWIAESDSSNSLNVKAYNGNTGLEIKSMAFNPPFGVTTNNVAIATDYKNPGFVANPYSIAVALTVNGSSNDSLLLFISNDAGDNWRHSVVYSTINYLHRVSMAYGYSPINNTGHFFVAAEYNYSQSELNNNQDILYLWRQEDLTGGAGIGYVDSANIKWVNNVGFPCVMVQNSHSIENDSLNLSAVLLFNSNQGTRAIATMLALQNSHKQWYQTNILSNYTSADNVPTNANGVYNNGNNTFTFALGNITAGAINYYELNVDSIGHNRDTSGPLPYQLIYGADSLYAINYANPHCDINPADSLPVADWIGGARQDTLTYTLFNSKKVIITSASLPKIMPVANVYPNPASTFINIVLPAQLLGNTQIDIYNLLGEKLMSHTNATNSVTRFNVSKLPPGNYFVRIINNAGAQVKKIAIIH